MEKGNEEVTLREVEVEEKKLWVLVKRSPRKAGWFGDWEPNSEGSLQLVTLHISIGWPNCTRKLYIYVCHFSSFLSDSLILSSNSEMPSTQYTGAWHKAKNDKPRNGSKKGCHAMRGIIT